MVDTFFNILRKSVVATFAMIFAFVVLYTPQQIRHVNEQLEGTNTVMEAEALFGVDIPNLIQNTISAVATLALHTKEFLLDGLAWAIAKSIVSSMVASLIDWVNSGFKGSPSFVQDFDKFLLDAADRAAGEYIDSLGGLGSFICSPFKLDIQIALSLKYQVARERRPASTCTLSGIVNNLEDFLNNITSKDSLDDWIKITTEPQTYTPYGQLLEAEAGMRVVLAGENMRNVEEARHGNGFLPFKKCQEAASAGERPKGVCAVVTPGVFIAEATSVQTDSGRQSLIEADEFNELIAALLGQLANKAITGAAGLLGLSASSGGSPSYTSSLANATQGAGDSLTSGQLGTMTTALQVQKDYKALATRYAPLLQAASNNPRIAADKRELARFEYDLATRAVTETTASIPRIETVIASYRTLETEYNASGTTATRKTAIRQEQSQLISTYSSISLYTRQNLDYSTRTWRDLTGV